MTAVYLGSFQGCVAIAAHCHSARGIDERICRDLWAITSASPAVAVATVPLNRPEPRNPLSDAMLRINAIARVGVPEVNAMTEGFLERE